MADASSGAVARLAQELKSALAARDRAGANAAVGKLLSRRAPLGAQWRSIAELMRVSGELTLAHKAMDAFVESVRNSPSALYSKVVLLTQSNRQREAYDLLSRLPIDVPTAAGHAYVLGNVAMTLGRVEEARDYLSLATRHQPGWGPAWLTLASTVNFARDQEMGDRLIDDGAAAARQEPGDHARYFYALGKYHSDRGEHAASAEAFARGARLLRSFTPYSREGNAANAQAAMTGYSPAFFERMRGLKKHDTSRPIFVSGLPRSGTTLVEHIVASHSTVLDGGELNLMPHIAVAADGVSGHSVEVYLGKGGSIESLGALYLHLLSERFGAPGRVVDKTIDISRCLGLIAAALPDAPVIWMKRDSLDNAWSCFRTFFIHGLGWSYDLADIAHHFRLEDQLRAYWQDMLGDRLLVVPYGALVDDPPLWTRRILSHCGLEEESAVHEAHKSERVVTTASALQVRRPINRDGMNVADPYRDFLQPFVDAYYD